MQNKPFAGCTVILLVLSWWMDGWVRVLRPFGSISVISIRWKGEHERLCALKRRLSSGRISPPAGFEPVTPWSEVGSANRSATRTLRFCHEAAQICMALLSCYIKLRMVMRQLWNFLKMLAFNLFCLEWLIICFLVSFSRYKLLLAGRDTVNRTAIYFYPVITYFKKFKERDQFERNQQWHLRYQEA